LFSLLSGFAASPAWSQSPGVDVRHYAFDLTLSDDTDEIEGRATLVVRFTQDGVSALVLDLIGADGGATGMAVKDVHENGASVPHTHRGNRLSIAPASPPKAGEERTYVVDYAGTPADGLIISQNRHGSRTFFGDNWPNRARHWLPVVDHPSDKATCEFVVTAPDRYQVIANGMLVEETDLTDGRRRSHWKTTVPLPTKVMVFGAARFAVQHAGEYEDIPIQAWVYPEDREAGFHDFGVTVDMLRFFETRIGPFPYEKLANVQSKTRYGGMENASAIFYAENAITGERANATTVAHEIAHQWFGDSVTEADWPHIWLSEGFATYFAELYYEHAEGRQRLLEGMRDAREAVLRYATRNPNAPLVDPRPTDPNDHLNTNSYQKGAWVLHMLRGTVGDDAFWAGIREYYASYRDANATSTDLQRIMERHSGQELGWFFDQWLLRGGHPKLAVSWSYDAGHTTATVTVTQQQTGGAFRLPLDLDFASASGRRRERVVVDRTSQTFTFASSERVTGVIVDPDLWVLLEAEVRP
jgi:aminopeptidase N